MYLCYLHFKKIRLTKAYADLQEYIESEVELKETKEYEAAVEILSQAREKIEES